MADYKELIRQLKATRKTVERELTGLDQSIAGLERAANIEPPAPRTRHVGDQEATETAILDYLKENPDATAPEVRVGIETEYSVSSIRNYLRQLTQQGLLQESENGRPRTWSLV